MAKGIYFKDVLKTVLIHDGTKIEYAIPSAKKKIEVLTNNGVMHDGFNTCHGSYLDKAKIITFAKDSPMEKLGIDQALLGYNKLAGVNTLSFWQQGNIVKAQVMNGKDKVDDIRNYLKVIHELIDSHFKLPS